MPTGNAEAVRGRPLRRRLRRCRVPAGPVPGHLESPLSRNVDPRRGDSRESGHFANP